MKKSFFILPLILISLHLNASGNIKLNKNKSVIIQPEEIKETFAFQYLKEFLYTINDSGNEPILYKIHPKSGEIIQRITIDNAKNIDWEDITCDKQNIYMDEIGNNLGTRKIFTNYYFAFDKIKPTYRYTTIQVDSIIFSFNSKIEITTEKPLVTNYDMESIFVMNNTLMIATKEWSSYNKRWFQIDTSSHLAKLKDRFAAKGLITAVDCNSNQLVMTSYTKKGQANLYHTKWQEGKSNLHNTKKYKLRFTPKTGQIEGVGMAPNGVYINGEEIKFLGNHSKQKLYFIPFSKIK